MADAKQKTLQKRQDGSRQPQNAIIPRPALHPTLVPELLGFSPQMLLDDIISSASDAIVQCLQAMEPFMQRWASTRTAPPPPPPKSKKSKSKKNAAQSDKEGNPEWDGMEAVEQGLVAFSTLLESHTDIAFDFFEAWSLRNIFALPPELKIVAPHQRGLDLDVRPEEEMELMADIEDLRRKIENQRRLKRMYTKALLLSRLGLHKSQNQLDRLVHLSPTSQTLQTLQSLPPQIIELFEISAALPHMDGLGGALQRPIPDPTKRMWEMGSVGYMGWAVQQLIAGRKEGEGEKDGQGDEKGTGGSSALWSAAERAEKIAGLSEIKELADDLKGDGETKSLGVAHRQDEMDTS